VCERKRESKEADRLRKGIAYLQDFLDSGTAGQEREREEERQ